MLDKDMTTAVFAGPALLDSPNMSMHLWSPGSRAENCLHLQW